MFSQVKQAALVPESSCRLSGCSPNSEMRSPNSRLTEQKSCLVPNAQETPRYGAPRQKRTSRSVELESSYAIAAEIPSILGWRRPPVSDQRFWLVFKGATLDRILRNFFQRGSNEFPKRSVRTVKVASRLADLSELPTRPVSTHRLECVQSSNQILCSSGWRYRQQCEQSFRSVPSSCRVGICLS